MLQPLVQAPQVHGAPLGDVPPLVFHSRGEYFTRLSSFSHFQEQWQCSQQQFVSASIVSVSIHKAMTAPEPIGASASRSTVWSCPLLTTISPHISTFGP